MKRLLKAASRLVEPGRVQAVAKAMAEFERLVSTHAGDRATFDSMISAHAGPEAEQIDLQIRRTVFRGNSHIWGAQVATQMVCTLLHPNAEDPERVDMAAVRGFLGLRRFRSDVSWIIARIRVTNEHAEVCPASSYEPLTSGGRSFPGSSVLQEFCRPPEPRIRSFPADARQVYVELLGDGVGNASEVTIVTGDVLRSFASLYRAPQSPNGRIVVSVSTPCKVLIHDVLVLEGMFGPITPEVLVYGENLGGAPFPASGRTRDPLPLRSSVVYLGKGPSALHTPDVPRYAEMARYACEKLGWDAERFDVYRCRIEYPVMPSAVIVQFDLPERGEG